MFKRAISILTHLLVSYQPEKFKVLRNEDRWIQSSGMTPREYLFLEVNEDFRHQMIAKDKEIEDLKAEIEYYKMLQEE